MKSKRKAPAKQKAFLAAYAKHGIVTAAARAARIARSQHYEWMEDPDYAAAFEDAHEAAIHAYEEEVHRRAVKGVLKPVFYQGKKIASVREYSDNLLMFQTKAMAPEKYRDNARIEHTGARGRPIAVEVTFVKP